MKKITFLFVSLFLFGALMAQIKSEDPNASVNFKINKARNGNTLYSQMNPYPGSLVASQSFPDMQYKYVQLADDFVVPAGETWTIDSVKFYGGNLYNSTGTADKFILQFYNDSSSQPKTLPFISDTLSYSDVSGLFGIKANNYQLQQGTYWISIMALMSYGTQQNQWGWAWNSAPQNGFHVYNRDPYSLVDPPNTWPPVWTDGAVTWGSNKNLDVSFELIGNKTSPPATPVSDWAIIFGVLLIGTFVVVKYRKTFA